MLARSVDNYRTEILGGICAKSLIKQAALTGRSLDLAGPIATGCDNNGIVCHGNKQRRPLVNRQA